ncbi:MAG: DUF1573 domain-containing protein [Bacteroides sp.]|nr:DUF1573 domain-containing protein [Bacteroides sp.]
MKTILILLGCSFILGSCSNPSSSNMEKIHPVVSIAETLKTDSIKPYLYIIKHNKYDFGTIKEDKIEVIPIDIEIGNSGNSPLVIQKADVSCGRISIEYPKAPVLPGKTAMIHIAVNTKGQKGYFNKTVFLKSNAANDVELIRITGQIK